MKTLYFLIFALIFLQISCESTKIGHGDEVNHCYTDYGRVESLYQICGISQELMKKVEIEAYTCTSTYRKDGYMNKSETYNTCHDFMDQFYNSCDGAETLTYDFLKNEKGCFNYPFKIKKEACVINKTRECETIFENCGVEKMGSMCQDYTTRVMDSEGNIEIIFNTSEIETYCESTINGDEELTANYTINDIFEFSSDWSYPMYFLPNCDEPVMFTCDNVPNIDFRNGVCPRKLD